MFSSLVEGPGGERRESGIKTIFYDLKRRKAKTIPCELILPGDS